MNDRKRNPVLAVDIGGTKIISALISPEYKILAKELAPTDADEGPERVIQRLISLVDKVLKEQHLSRAGLDGIGIAVAGAIDTKKGVVTISPNLPGWRDIPIRDIIREKLGIKTYVVNDAHAAAVGEHRLGAGKGAANMVLLTIGTGIGGGIIIKNELYEGAVGSGGELGHMIIDPDGPRCACGVAGCLEALASGTAMAREGQSRVLTEKSILMDMVNGNIKEITARKIEAAARQGDKLSLDIVARAGYYLGIGLVNVVNIFNPEAVIIGGGVSELGEMLLGPARRVVYEKAIPISARTARITTALMHNDAGIYGAAILAFEQKSGEK